MGFSQEMKDFLGAYKTGQSINASRTDQDYRETQTKALGEKAARDNDPKTLKTAQDQAEATLANTHSIMKERAAGRGESSLNSAQLREYRALQMDAIRNPQKYGGGQPGIGLPTSVGDTGPVPPGQGVLPIPQATISDEPAYVPQGPAVRGYFAEGGLVDDEPDEGGGGALDIGDEGVSAPTSDATDFSAQSRQPRAPRGLEGVVSPQLIRDAAKAGMTYGLKQAGYGGAVPSSRTAANARLIAQGQGGLNEEEMQAARRTVDPEGKMTDSQRNMAALGSTYQYFANKGEPEKAQRVAFQMLQYYRNASQRYAAIAAKAAEGGNIDLATKAALKAYQNVPDGNDLEIVPDGGGGLMYRVTGPKGEVIRKGIATPQQLAASAMGLATGGFDKAIIAAAGGQADTGAVSPSGKGAGAGAARVQTAADRKAEGDLVTPEIEKLKTAYEADGKAKKLDEGFWPEATDTTQHILQQNKSVTPAEAARAAQLLLSPNMSKDKSNFKISFGKNEGDPATVTFPNKMKLQLDDNMIERIENSRAARVKAEALAEKEATKPGFMEKAGGVLSDIGGYAATAVKDDIGRAGKAISESVTPETAARAKSALNAAARMGGDAGAYVIDLIKKDLRGDTNISPERVGRDIVGAAGAVGDMFRSKGALPVDEIGPAP